MTTNGMGESELPLEPGEPVRMLGVAVDITEPREAEEKSRTLGQLLVSTLETMPEGFYTVDGDWHFTYVNREAERICRRSREEMLGQTLWSLFPTTRGTAAEVELEKAMRTKVGSTFELYFEPFASWFQMRILPSAEGLAVYLRDVGAERQARESLRLSEERFRLLSKATNDAVWDWNLITKEIWWNEGLQTLFGYPLESVRFDFDWWAEHVHAEDQQEAVGGLLAAVESGETTWSAAYRFQRHDGSYAHVLDRGYVLRDPKGQAIRMIGSVADLSERISSRRRIEEQAALLDQARDAILVRGLDHRIHYCNKSAERLYGWSEAELLGLSVRDLFYEEPTPFDEAMQRVHAQGGWVGELTQLRKDGQQLIVECRWTLVRDEGGKPRAVFVINTDITERKELERQFFRAQRMESIGTLAGGVAHDLNNALSPVIMALEILKLRFHDSASLELLEIVRSSAERGADMVRQVLSFARGVEGLRIEVGLPTIIREVRKIATETFLKHIQIRTKVADDLWTVTGDPTQIHQVLLNLCVNARDAMIAGGVLTITATNVTLQPLQSGFPSSLAPGAYVCLEVKDTGMGITAETLEKIFDPFFTTKPIGQGTGLGLSTSLAIVKSHGGIIQVQSRPSVGTTFQVYLPACGARPAVEAPVLPELPGGQGERILVVDDEAPVREITKRTLESFGYQVFLAANGAEALSIYVKETPTMDVVVTDMMMPVMDGPALIAALLRMQPTVRIIGASGLTTSDQAAQARQLGVKHFLPKPFTTRELLLHLQAVLRGA